MTTTENTILMDGKTLAASVLERAAAKVARIRAACGVQPALATVLVGADPASATYVKMKVKRCIDAGMKSVKIDMSAETTTEELVAKVTELGADPAVNGILLQHPVPDQIDERAAFEAIPVEKDVDGVTAAHAGPHVPWGMPAFGSCTPAGIMTLLDDYKVELNGAARVVIGRSPILGKPMAAMLLNRHAR
jgi:methylenetetrahydrofolate dehydrogenase (NADP+)/methenyltetrahydrofolate cyclohydrolase